MSSSSSTVSISVSLRRLEYRVYVTAQRNLRRILGTRAPDVDALIQAQIAGRDAVGIADEYLDRIGWPGVSGRMISLQGRPKSKSGTRLQPAKRSTRVPLSDVRDREPGRPVRT